MQLERMLIHLRNLSKYILTLKIISLYNIYLQSLSQQVGVEGKVFP